MTHPTDPDLRELERPDLLLAARTRLSRVERFNLWLVQRSFVPGFFDSLMRVCQRSVGQGWIHHATKHLRISTGLSNLPDLESPESLIVVANHRSFFDLYIITMELMRRRLRKRIIFMVRSRFFYDTFIGTLVNFTMSFLAMYPPVFRERKKAAMNLMALGELSYLLRQGGFFCGLHPEGTRKRDEDPYTFLPAQAGVGRVIYESRVPVVPVFINGLENSIWTPVKGNFTRRGKKIITVFGSPIDFTDLYAEPPTPATYRAIAERCMEQVGSLCPEEKRLRACSPAGS